MTEREIRWFYIDLMNCLSKVLRAKFALIPCLIIKYMNRKGGWDRERRRTKIINKQNIWTDFVYARSWQALQLCLHKCALFKELIAM